MSEVKNHYEHIPKKFKEEERHYENEKKIRIKLPFRMCIIGASGSGKTNCLIEIIEQMNAWDKIIIMAKNTEEPLYASLIDTIQTAEKKAETQILTVGNKIEELPDLKTLDKKNNTLVIIDDMINEKDKLLGRVADYYTMGRKQNVSTIFLSQSYFKIPKIIRENTGYFIFTKISGDRDLLMILKDFELGVTEEQLIKLYRQAASGFPNFFLIDRETNDKDLVFRKNFAPMKPPETTETKAASNIVAPPLPGNSKRGRKFNNDRKQQEDVTPIAHTTGPPAEYYPSPTVIELHPQPHRAKKEGRLLSLNELPEKMQEEAPDWLDDDEMEEGEGLRKRRKKNPRKGKGVTDAELRRMLRLYGFS